MAQLFVEPIAIRRAAKPGETVKQDFVVNVVPSGDLVATIVGGDGLIRLEAFVAYRLDRHAMTEEEIEELPPALRDEARRKGWIEYVEIARATDGEPLSVFPSLHVHGYIEFAAPQGQSETTINATLALDGWGKNRIEIPLLFVIGDVQVEFLSDPIDGYQGQEVSLPVRVSLSSGSPSTQLTLKAFEPNFLIHSETVTVPGGGSVTTTLQLRTEATAPLGAASTRLSVDGFAGRTIFFPFDVIVHPFSQQIRAAEQIRAKAAVIGEGPPGPHTPISGVEDAGGGGFVQQFSSGNIYWHPDSGARWVYGAILAKYRHLDGPRGLLGYPRSDEVGTSDGRGRMNAFERGDIYFSPQSGAQEIHGSIRGRWISLGAENSYLGYPTFDQRGRMSRFQAGTIQLEPNEFVFDVSDAREIISGVIHVDGAAANGWCELRLSSTGGWLYKGSMRSTGALSYDVMMVTSVDLRPVGGPVLAFVEKGNVEGTLVFGGRRDHPWDTYGMDNRIKDNWGAIRGGAAVQSIFTVEFGLGDLLQVVGSILAVPLAVIGIIVAGIFFGRPKKRCGRYRGQEHYNQETKQWEPTEGDVWVDEGEMCAPGLDP